MDKNITIFTKPTRKVAIWVSFFPFAMMVISNLLVKNGFDNLALVVLWTSVIAISIITILSKKEPPREALTLNEKGITEHLQFKELGTIPWEDIEFAGVKNKFWRQYVIVKVKNPLEYINKVSANFKLKKLLRENNAKHQTPIVINTSELNITPYELRDLIKNEWRKHQYYESIENEQQTSQDKVRIKQY